MSEMAEAIRALVDEKGYSEEAVKQTIENALKAAYKRTYGNSDNAIVKFAEDLSDVSIYSRKTVVDGVTYINIASITLPKNGCAKCYGILDEKGVQIFDLNDQLILEEKF